MAEMYKVTEISSYEIPSDNVLQQRLLFAYEQAAQRVKGNVLEVGCGVGKGAELFQEKCENYTAIDKNEALINHLQEKYPDFKFIDAFIPPFQGVEDNSFDVVVTQQVIEHIEDDHFFLREIYRVLKPGGYAIITTPNKNLSLSRNPWHVREYLPEEMREILEKYFEKVELKGIAGNEKVMNYHEENRKSVERITRWDIFDFQYRLPRRLLQVPYDILNRLNRDRLLKQSKNMVLDVSTADFFLTNELPLALDYFAIVHKIPQAS